MERKRYFFKLEMEQLSRQYWLQVKSAEIIKNMRIQDKLEIVDLIEILPDSDFDNLRTTVRKIRDEADLKYMKEHPESFRMLFLSESSFAGD
jgi:ribosomal 50S subunit-associated protein YjgA (DUF615 family)